MQEKHPITFIIFGATGDLAQKKLLPALMNLYCQNFLPENFKIIGYSRKDLSDQNYREFALNAIKAKEQEHSQEGLEQFLSKVHYKQGDINDLENYEELSKYLRDLDTKEGDCSNKLFYLAVPPNLYENIFTNLAESGLSSPCTKDNNERWTRILVEKPFGIDRDNAKKLDKILGELFTEDQIFRIDHYLAKETIRNILTFRFANAIFEPIWNKDHIEKVEIRLLEKADVADRSSFYRGLGALRDVGQNHLLQMLALVAMEDPMSMKADAIRKLRSEVFSQVSCLHDGLSEFVRAQYDGYRDGDYDVSQIETYFKIKMCVNNKRWDGAPFYLESGKALNEDKTEIVITFKDRESAVCVSADTCEYNNTLTISIKPEQKISIRFWAKKPGLTFDLDQKDLTFAYDINDSQLSNDYEKVLFDCINGDQSLFTSTAEVKAQWEIISQILKMWQKLPLLKYQKGVNPMQINSEQIKNN